MTTPPMIFKCFARVARAGKNRLAAAGNVLAGLRTGRLFNSGAD